MPTKITKITKRTWNLFDGTTTVGGAALRRPERAGVAANGKSR